MSHLSPAVYLLWTCLMATLGAFLMFHLWNFDRFKCLKWNSPYSGAFKRVMTYSYIVTIPLIAVYTVGYVVIKYQEGYMFIPGYGIIPTPYILWKEASRNAIFPLQLTFSIGWSFEMVTHLEELCFWLFLVNAGHAGQDWFRSNYFKVWISGSVCAVIYMPVVAIATRGDPLRSEASIILSGALGSLALTLWFTPILFSFPRFIEGLRKEGVDSNTVVRLTKFHELNSVRVFFRYLFSISFVILGLDGIQGKHHINESAFWTDLLGFLAALGVCISSAITLVIFFPRNIQGEIDAKEVSRDARRTRRGLSTISTTTNQLRQTETFRSDMSGAMEGLRSQPFYVPQHATINEDEDSKEDYPVQEPASHHSPPPLSAAWDPTSYRASHQPQPHQPGMLHPSRSITKFSPNRRLTEQEGGGVEMGAIAIDDPAARGRSVGGNVNPLLHNFTSPIDLASGVQRPRGANAV